MSNPGSTINNETDAPATARRGRKWVTYTVLGVLLAVGLLAALAPTLLSTSWGRGLIVGAINDGIRGSVSIDTLSLNWLGGQEIRGVAVADPSGRTVARLDELSTELTLLQAVRARLSLGLTTIRGLTAELIVDESGDNNLSRALEPTHAVTEETGPILIPLTGNIELSDVRVTVTAPNTQPVVFEGLAGNLRVDPVERTLDVGLQGRSRQGEKAGEFALTGQVLGLIAADGSLTPHTARGSLEANVQDLPIDGIDGMLGLQGLLSAAVGKSANLELRASGTAETQQLTAAAESPNLQAAIAARVQQEQLALTEPATLRLNVQPSLFQALTKPAEGEAALRLVEAFPLNVRANQLNFSVADFNPGKLALRAGVDAQRPIRLAGGPEVGEVAIRNLTAAIDSEGLAETVRFALDGEAVTQNKPGNLKVQGTLSQLFDPQGRLQPDRMRADAEANLTSVPTALVDQLSGQEGLLVDLLGPKMNVQALVKSSGPERIDGTLNLDAGPLRAQDVALSISDAIVLAKPAEIRYRLSPEVVRRLLGKEQTLALQQPAAIVVQLQALSAPRPKVGEAVFQPSKTQLRAAMRSDTLALSGIPDLGAVQIDDAHFELTADTLTAIRLGGGARASGAKDSVLAELGASPLQLRIDASTGLKPDGALEAIAMQLKLSSEGVNSELKASVDPDFSRASLTAPASLGLRVTPGLLKRLGLVAPNQPNLAKPATVQVDLARLELPLAAFALAGVQTKATARIDELILAGDKSVTGTALRNADLALDYEGSRGAAALKFAADTTLPGQQKAGALKLDATLNGLLRNGELDLARAGINARAKIDNLPTALLEALSGQAGLVAALGESMNVDAGADIGGDDKRAGTIDVKAQSQNLVADAGFKLGEELVLSRAANLRWTVTPAAYAALTATPPAASEKGAAPTGYELAEVATLETVVNQLRWPLAAADVKPSFNPSRAAVDVAVKAPRVALRDGAGGQTLVIEGLQGALRGADLSKPIGIELSGQVRDARGGEGAGGLALSGQAADVFTAEGQLNTEGLSLQLKGQLQKLPVALLDQMLAMDGLTVATLGPTTDVNLDADLQRMTGPLTLQLRSANARADINAQLRKDGLILNEPLVAEVQVTQAFGQLVLGKIHPIFETTQSSERPIRFEVPQEGVLIPIRDYAIGKVAIPRMTLDLGTLALKSGWLLKGTIGLAQQFGALQGSGRDQWAARFTPAILQLREGKLTYERRLDLLLDERLHLATWGTVDIANDRADLTIAFMPETLEKVFGLTVAPNDAFRIPLQGALSKPSMDFGKAGLELGRLRAQKRLAGKDKLIGALVGGVAATATGGAPIPRASVEPLPWGPLPVPEGQAEAKPAEETTQAAEPAPRKSTKEQAIEGLIDIFRKK